MTRVLSKDADGQPNIQPDPLIEAVRELYPDCDYERFSELLDRYRSPEKKAPWCLDHKSVYMIAYGDSITDEGTAALPTLQKFADTYLKDCISDIHILPMFPSSGDDGFSVTDHYSVAPEIGTWEDVTRLGQEYHLTFDFVANHISKQSDIFQSYIQGDPIYKDFFIEYDEFFDYTNVFRPRESPLFHSYGEHRVWTTFSEDQIDLNYKNYNVFLWATEILLSYAKMGASCIRLDAVGYLWKESGTSCLNLEQAHKIVKIWRAVLERIQPQCGILTETNVPHEENVRYFGDGDESNMIYQFALPPLVLYTFITGNAAPLSNWAKTIEIPGKNMTYYNFLSSHDGIGMKPVNGILSPEDQLLLVSRAIENGGCVSYGVDRSGKQSVYELNINYHAALVNRNLSDELQLRMILAANAILLSMVGVPAIYYNSLLGDGNDLEGYRDSGIKRRINRRKYRYSELCSLIEHDPVRNQIFQSLSKMILWRSTQTAFDPWADQEILDHGDAFFSLMRYNKRTGSKVQLIVNVTGTPQLWNGTTLEPYEFRWI